MDRYEIPLRRVEPAVFHQELLSREPYEAPWGALEKMMASHHMQSDRQVTISREKLVEKLRENRNTHAAIYTEAMEGYWDKLKVALYDLEAAATLLTDNSDTLQAYDYNKLTRPLAQVDRPNNYLQAYDEAIELFDWDESPSVELNVSEFRKFVLDKWDWQDVFLAKSAGTSRMARNRLAQAE